jgi:serine/threonine-protein kinase RsbW
MTKFTESYTFASDDSQFNRFYEIATNFTQRLQLQEAEQFRFLLCLSEAFTNAVVHGNHLEADKQVRITFAWDINVVEVCVEDEGDAVPADIDLVSASAAAEADATTGRGIGIIKHYVDNLIVETKPEGGLRLRIRWQLRQAPAAARERDAALS